MTTYRVDMEITHSSLRVLPDTPGVYFFIGARREILYIGKATSLKSRVRSYFSNNLAETRGPLIIKMLEEAQRVEYMETDSVLEALLIETNLIRTHKPRYNTLAKDDKSYNHVIITNEKLPRVLVVRSKNLVKYPENTLLCHFGPFPHGTLFKEALAIIRKLFRFYDEKMPKDIGSRSKVARGIVDFNRQIGLYPEEGNIEAYQQTIKHIALFFQGKKGEIITDLRKSMMAAASEERFEDAQMYKKKIFALQHIQDVALLKANMREYTDEKSIRIEAYDVAHFGGDAQVGVMAVVEGGEPRTDAYRSFTIRSVSGAHDIASLREVLERRLMHTEWSYPQLIVVDGGVAQRNAAERVLKEAGVVIPVVGVVKDIHHKPKRIIGPRTHITRHQDAIIRANAEAHRFSISLHRTKLRKRIVS